MKIESPVFELSTGIQSGLGRFLSLFTLLIAGLCPTDAAVPFEPAHRHVFIVDQSFSMARMANVTRNEMFETIRSGAGGRIKTGDLLEVWTFDEDVHLRPVNPQVWMPELQDAIASRLTSFFKQIKHDRQTRVDRMLDTLNRAAAFSQGLTARIFTDGDDEFRGTPFDAELNKVLQQETRGARKPKQPLQIVLTANRGSWVSWAVFKTGQKEPVAASVEQPVVAEQPPDIPPPPVAAPAPALATPPVPTQESPKPVVKREVAPVTPPQPASSEPVSVKPMPTPAARLAVDKPAGSPAPLPATPASQPQTPRPAQAPATVTAPATTTSPASTATAPPLPKVDPPPAPETRPLPTARIEPEVTPKIASQTPAPPKIAKPPEPAPQPPVEIAAVTPPPRNEKAALPEPKSTTTAASSTPPTVITKETATSSVQEPVAARPMPVKATPAQTTVTPTVVSNIAPASPAQPVTPSGSVPGTNSAAQTASQSQPEEVKPPTAAVMTQATSGPQGFRWIVAGLLFLGVAVALGWWVSRTKKPKLASSLISISIDRPQGGETNRRDTPPTSQ